MTANTYTPEPGIYPDVPTEDYFAWSAVSRSELVELARSPARYRWYKFEREREEHTGWVSVRDAFPLGNAIHDAVLLPDTFAERYAVGPVGNAATKAVKEARRAIEEEHHDKVLLSGEAAQVCFAIRESVWRNEFARKVLNAKGSQTEVAVVWRDEETGILCKARLDLWIPERARGPAILDLKSTTSAEAEPWARDAIRHKYHYQAAWYSEGASIALGKEVTPENFLFLAYEKSAPFASSVHRFDDDAIACAKNELHSLLRVLKVCQDKDEWPDYSNTINTISLPEYAKGLPPETELILNASA